MKSWEKTVYVPGCHHCHRYRKRVYCLDYNMHMPLGFLSDLCHTFPLYSLGLGWAGAAAAAALMSHLAYRLRSRRVSQNETEAAA